MTSLRNLSISHKLLLIIMITTGSALALSGVLFVCYETLSYQTGIVGKYRTLANIICKELSVNLANNQPLSATEVISDLDSDSQIREVVVYSTDGQVFASYLRGDETRFSHSYHSLMKHHSFDGLLLSLQQPIQVDGRPVGSIWLQMEMIELSERLAQFARIFISVFLLTILLGLFISSRLQKIISSPLHHLAEIARQVTQEENYSLRAKNTGADEIELLTESFNNMLEQIQHRDLELEQIRNNLENEITTRTSELRLMNKDLTLANENAVAAVKTKAEFLANMSHEIRTPMNGIMGIADMALTYDLDDQTSEYLSMIMSSAESLLAIINDILDFSKIEAGHLDLAPDQFTLREFIHTTLKMLAIKSCQKELELSYRISPDVPDQLIGDTGRLGQILINLISNSIKFTDQGEILLNIELAPEQMETSLESNPPTLITQHDTRPIMLIFSVQDTGIGIPHDDHQKIFDAFSQVDSSTTRSFGGTGLGLAISCLLVKMMKGKIWVNSVPDEGSTFSFTSRLRVTTETVQPDNLNIGPIPINSSIFLINHNATCQSIIHELLESWHIQTIGFNSEKEALSSLGCADSSDHPSLAIIEFQPSSPDPLAIIDQIRQFTGPDSPIILLLPTVIDNQILANIKTIESVRYISKPISATELHTTISRMINPDELTDSSILPRAS